jgi:hypothetical protein
MSCATSAGLAVTATAGQYQIDLPSLPVAGAPVYVVSNGSRLAEGQDFTMLEHRVLFADPLTEGDQITVRWQT